MSFEGERLESLPYIRLAGYSYLQYFTREYLGACPETGRVRFHRNSRNADGTFDKTIVYDARDASNVIIEGKSGDPKGHGGFSTNVRYKGLTVSALFSYEYGRWIWDHTQTSIALDGSASFWSRMTTNQLRRWQKPGDITDEPRRMPFTYGAAYNSTRMLQKGDYLRLKNMTISYNVPQTLVRKVGIDMVRVYASGTNLLTFAGTYFDPESPRYTGYLNFNTPPVRTITFGLEITL